MEIDIITYNHKLVKIGNIFWGTGLILGLPLAFISDRFSVIGDNFGLIFLYFSSSSMIIGLLMVNYFSKKTSIIGNIIFEKEETIINENAIQNKVTNNDFFIKFSKSGFKGQNQSYILFPL